MSNIKKRGFASLSIEHVKQIASMGGKTAHKMGKGNQFTPDQARKAAQARWAQKQK